MAYQLLSIQYNPKHHSPTAAPKLGTCRQESQSYKSTPHFAITTFIKGVYNNTIHPEDSSKTHLTPRDMSQHINIFPSKLLPHPIPRGPEDEAGNRLRPALSVVEGFSASWTCVAAKGFQRAYTPEASNGYLLLGCFPLAKLLQVVFFRVPRSVSLDTVPPIAQPQRMTSRDLMPKKRGPKGPWKNAKR